MDYPASFGSWLQRRRKSLDLTQHELAHRVGCSIDTIKKIETDLRRPSRQLAELLADQLELTGPDRTAFIKAARGTLAFDRLASLNLPIAGPGPAAAAMPAHLSNPYKGLRAFQEADAPDFFGRTDLVQRLLERLAEPSPLARFLAVVGPSGSGKSSVVQAGLLPALRRGGVPGSSEWVIVEMFPGSQPLEELESGLSRATGQLAGKPVAAEAHNLLLEDEHGLVRLLKRNLSVGCELLLVIDQFEEVFTLVDDAAIRNHFLNLLCTAVAEPHSPLHVVITLRADFYDRPLQYGGFGELVSRRTEAVPPLTADELHQAVAGPPARVGVTVEPALIAVLTREMSEQPGALPLLQYALTELFEHRDDHLLSLAAYRTGGGVTGALSKRAELLFTGLNAEAQAAARQVFLRLLTLGEGVEDTRCRVPITELAAVVQDETSLDAVLDAYGYARLLTFDRDPLALTSTVEVAHEALIRTWPRLRAWVDASRGDVRMQRLLAAAVTDWRANSCEPSYLWSGARLDGFAVWAAQTSVTLTPDEQAFLAAGVQLRDEQDAAEQARRQRELDQARALAAEQQQRADAQSRAAAKLRRGAYFLAAAFALALIVAAVAVFLAHRNADLAAQNAQIAAQARTAELQAQQNYASAESQRLAAESTGILQRGESAELATLVALRAIHIDYTPEADAALQRAARTYFGDRLFAHPTRVDAIAFAPDGRTFASGGGDGIIRTWDVRTGKEVNHFKGGENRFAAVLFSPDGSRLLSQGAGGLVTVWERNGRELRHFQQPGSVNFVSFAADGIGIWIGGPDMAQEWQIDSGALLRHVATGQWSPVAISADDTLLLTAKPDGAAQLLDAASGRILYALQGHTGPLLKAHFSPGNHTLLTTSADKTAILWDTATGHKLATFTGHKAAVTDAGFAADNMVVTSSADMTVGLWDAATGAQRDTLAVHTAPVGAVAVAPQGTSFLSAADDGSVRLWAIAKAHEPDIFAAQSGALFGLSFSADGKELLTGSRDQSVVVWDAANQHPLQTIRLDHDADTASFTPDGSRLLVAGTNDGPVQLLDLHSGVELLHLAQANRVRGATFTPDGKSILTGTADEVDIWDAQSDQRTRQIPIPGGSLDVIALSRDGRYLATGSLQVSGAHVRLWDLATGRQLRDFSDPSPVNAIAFSSDGKLLVSAGRDNEARLWDVASGHLVRTFIGHTAPIWSAAFSPDGKYVLTASQDRTAILWDITNSRKARVFPGHAGAAVANAIFAPDGRSVVISSFDGTAERTPVDVDDLLNSVCHRMLRQITTDERLLYHIRLVYNDSQAFWGKGCG